MTIDQLRAFILVYETRNVLRASEALHLAHSSVASRIRALEREVGSRLFVRLPQGVRPTRKAEILYRLASRSVASHDETERAIKPEKDTA